MSEQSSETWLAGARVAIVLAIVLLAVSMGMLGRVVVAGILAVLAVGLSVALMLLRHDADDR